LIVGCGCRGLSLTRALRASGHAVRGTTREPGRRAEIEAAGAEAFVGDPDRVATLARALEHVGVAVVLLGSATGDAEDLRALHSTRLDMLLERMLDTTVRGIVYEAVGTVPQPVLADGVARVRRACASNLIPYALLEADPSDHTAWTACAVAAFETALSGGRQGAGSP
jgi:threonine dehydrogenase-like Zn-dependent dehydrogenase